MTTEQRLCAVRFCGHPESSHFCEDEGGPEAYHGDDWCADCEKLGTAHEFEPASAPTPSLEEARRRVERAWYLYDGCVDRDEVEAAVKAFARAEVIREVEAWLDDGIAYREASGDDAVVSAFETLKLFTARLRALSQGGEGKA